MSDLVLNYVDRISSSWRESVEKILETARLLVESETVLTEKEFLDLISRLPISQSTISKLIMIGRNEYLPTRIQHLPPHWTTIYEISQFDEVDLDKGVIEGYITPSSTKKDIDRFRKSSVLNVPTSSQFVENFEPVLGSITVPNDFDLSKIDLLSKELKRLENKFGIHFHTDKTKKGMLGIRRKKLSVEIEEWLLERETTYNKLNLSFDDIQILEDSFNQLRGELEYHKNSDGTYIANDIRNPAHPYFGKTSKDLYQFCRENMILCRWTQMKEIDKEAYIKTLVKIHCDGDSKKRSDSKKKLTRLLSRGNEESKYWAGWALETIVEGDDE